MVIGTLPDATAQSLDVIDREFSKLVEDVSPSVVRIGNGMTGVCVSDKGHILTHIVVGRQLSGQGEAANVMISFANQGTYAAALVQLDEATGTSLLKIADRRRFPATRPGLASSLEVGHLLITVGNAFNSAVESEPAATLGVLSAIRRDPKGRAMLLETSAATNPGQTGSPFFDMEGALIGLARSLPTDQDLATVVPIDRILDVYRDVDERDRIFDRPLTRSPSRSSAQVLSRAFAIAAVRARAGVVTLHITRPAAETNVAAADVDAPRKTDGAPDGEPGADAATPPLIPRRNGPLSATIVDARGFLLAPLADLEGEIASILALLHDGRSYRASLVARDRKAGLALLLMDKPPSAQLPVLPVRGQSDLEPGQFLIAVGAPHGTTAPEGPFATVGILSSRHRLDPWRDALQTDAGVNVKNAGGALVDLRGRQVGVILPPETPYGQNSGLGFAMPMDAVAKSLTRLMEGKDVEAAYLGVRLGDDEGARGAVVVEVYEGYPAERAGLRKGDLITALDLEAITRQKDLSDYLYGQKTPGDPLSITVSRDGTSTELFAVLTKRPG